MGGRRVEKRKTNSSSKHQQIPNRIVSLSDERTSHYSSSGREERRGLGVESLFVETEKVSSGQASWFT